jgi:hypothetical protein
MKISARLIALFIAITLAGCAASQKSSQPLASNGSAKLTVFFKSDSAYSGAGPYLFLDQQVIGRVPPRGVLTVLSSAGSTRLSLNGFKSGPSFFEWISKEITLKEGERKYLIYDQSTTVLFEVAKEQLAEFQSQYPVIEHEPSNIAKNLGQAILLPIMLPGIVVFSVLTGEPLQ